MRNAMITHLAFWSTIYFGHSWYRLTVYVYLSQIKKIADPFIQIYQQVV